MESDLKTATCRLTLKVNEINVLKDNNKSLNQIFSHADVSRGSIVCISLMVTL